MFRSALTPEHAEGGWAGDGPFFEAPRLMAPAIRLRDDRRGARHWARIARRKLVFGRFGPDHDAVMRIGGEAPGGGPILSVGIGAMFEYGFPPPRIVDSAVRRKASASAE